MEFSIIKYKQNDHELISTVLPFEIIKESSKVLVYGQDEGGYQREPDSNHFSKIAKYINEDNSFIFPTSIILGVDKNSIDKITYKDETKISIDKNNVDIFRIIDGQHRIKGIEKALIDNPQLNNLMLNVTILITPENKRSMEMEIFNTINSKSKRIKVDLIRLASFEYRILENDIKYSDLNEHIAVQVAHYLNEDNSKNNKWFNAIKFGIHEEQKIGIIGVNAFIESIKKIINKYLENKEYKNLKGKALIDFSKESALNIKEFILDAWTIIYEKWPDSFTSSYDMEFDSEIKQFYYRSNYYIQKTLGTKAINYLLGNIVNESVNSNLDQKSLNTFSEFINSSHLLNKDWKLGETFSGYSSESAFNKISKMITGELEIPR